MNLHTGGLFSLVLSLVPVECWTEQALHNVYNKGIVSITVSQVLCCVAECWDFDRTKQNIYKVYQVVAGSMGKR